MASATEERYAKCVNCKHWSGVSGSVPHQGDCRRYPPIVIEATIEDHAMYNVLDHCFFPNTTGVEVCGEWVSMLRDRELSE